MQMWRSHGLLLRYWIVFVLICAMLCTAGISRWGGTENCSVDLNSVFEYLCTAQCYYAKAIFVCACVCVCYDAEWLCSCNVTCGYSRWHTNSVLWCGDLYLPHISVVVRCCVKLPCLPMFFVERRSVVVVYSTNETSHMALSTHTGSLAWCWLLCVLS